MQNSTGGILFIAGTRPEIIKMVPVVKYARESSPSYPVNFVLTGQHTSLAQMVLNDFNVQADEERSVLKSGSTLAQLTVRLMQVMEEFIEKYQPNVIVVQGDTTTAMTAGLAAFSHRIPVAHIEAGLRSGDLNHPYPEEANRKIISAFGTLHFAPTQLAKDNLLKEGVVPDKIITVGNTAVDAVDLIKKQLPLKQDPKKQILVTLHRRESWDGGIAESCNAIKRLAEKYDELSFIFPVHSNPIVQTQVQKILGDIDSINLTEPMGYLELQATLVNSWLVLTDSGGIQEEAPSYNVPVLVLREVTERPEAVQEGMAKVIGTSEEMIFASCTDLLNHPESYHSMRKENNPFGDGQASQRIYQALDYLMTGQFEKIAQIEEFV